MASEELVPFKPRGEVEPQEEIVDGEFVGSDRPDIRWEQWWHPDKFTTIFKLEIDESWYKRVPREDWDRLNALAAGLVELQRRTTRGV